MHFEVRVEIEAPAAATWTALTRIEDWPRWTASMQAVRWLNGAGLWPGAQARVKQPGMPPLVWTVSELEEGRVFTWNARSPGVRTVGAHRVQPLSANRSLLCLGVDQTGALAPLAEMLMGARTRRFVTLEGEGLKRAAEATGELRRMNSGGTPSTRSYEGCSPRTGLWLPRAVLGVDDRTEEVEQAAPASRLQGREGTG